MASLPNSCRDVSRSEVNRAIWRTFKANLHIPNDSIYHDKAWGDVIYTYILYDI